MLKFYSFLIAMLLFSENFAQSTVLGLIINKKNGTFSEFEIQDIQRITFGNDNIKVLKKNATSPDILITEIDKLFFKDVLITKLQEKEINSLANSFDLSPNYPNPFNPSTTIHYSIPTQEKVEVSIYNINGALVKELFSTVQKAGNHKVKWDGRDETGKISSSGIYFSQVKYGKITKSQKMSLIK